MQGWRHTVKIKHLFTKNEDYESVQESMKNIADKLKTYNCFFAFDKTKFYQIPENNDFFEPVECANKLLDQMYNFADYHRIWIE